MNSVAMVGKAQAASQLGPQHFQEQGCEVKRNMPSLVLALERTVVQSFFLFFPFRSVWWRF